MIIHFGIKPNFLLVCSRKMSETPPRTKFLNAESCRGSKSCEWHLEGGKKYHFDLEELKQRRMEFFDEEWHTVNIRDVRQISILKLAASSQQV